MALDLTSFPSPITDTQVRSAVELLRRILLLRWSTGKYLDAVTGNYGIKRPYIGLSDDDLFRACAQVLMADYKVIASTFFQLLEILIGPYENTYFTLSSAATTSSGYLLYDVFGDYVEYAAGSYAGGPFTAGERVYQAHPVTGDEVEAIFVYLDTTANRMYFSDFIALDGEHKSFWSGVDIVGRSSGAQITSSSIHNVEIGVDRFPLYARATIYSPGTNVLDPNDVGASNQEEVILVSPSPYLKRVRLKNYLTSSHASGEMIYVSGGCWELSYAQARRIAVRILCSAKRNNILPGNSYIHPKAYLESPLRSEVNATDTVLPLDDYWTEGINTLSYARKVIVDPEGKRDGLEGGAYLADVSSFNLGTRSFQLSAPVPAGRKWRRRTTVRWYQALEGQFLAAPLVTDTQIHVRCRAEDPRGVWTLDPGGAGEQKVFVTGTTFQVRRLKTQLVAGTTQTLYAEKPFAPIDLTLTDRLRVISISGVLGTVTISSIASTGEITLTAPAGFNTSIYTEETYLIVESSLGGEYLTLSEQVGTAHAIGVTMEYYYGTSSTHPTYSDHLIDGGYPPGVTPSGKWSGPNIFDPSRHSPTNDDGDGVVTASFDRTGVTDPTQLDARIYVGSTELAATFDKSTASTYTPAAVGPPVLPDPGTVYKVPVVDGRYFPTTAIIDLWRQSPLNNTTGSVGYPLRVVVGSEGGYGRTPLYYWGKEQDANSSYALLYISGIQRIHSEGVNVASFVEKLPVKGDEGIFEVGIGANFESEGDVIINHGSFYEERVDYDSIELIAKGPSGGEDRAAFVFDRGWIPTYSHDPNETNPLDSSDTLGSTIVRSDNLAVPRDDGFSFPLYFGGDSNLIRLRWVVDLVRAAGVEVKFYDENDKEIQF